MQRQMTRALIERVLQDITLVDNLGGEMINGLSFYSQHKAN